MQNVVKYTVMVCFVWGFFASQAVARTDLPPDGAVDAVQDMALVKKLGSKLHILDVRSAEEYSQGHIAGAQLLPLPELATSLARVPQGKPLLIVCRTGRRAKAAYEQIHAAWPERRVWYLHAKPSYTPSGFTFAD